MKRAFIGVLLASSWMGCNALVGNKDAYLVEDADGSTTEGGATNEDGGALEDVTSGEDGGAIVTDGAPLDAPVGDCQGCLLLASGFRAPRALVLDGAYVYYAVQNATGGGDAIWRVPRDGTGAANELTRVAGEITALAVGTANIYFAVQTTGWSISRIPLTGGSITAYSARAFGTGPVTQIRVLANAVLWNFDSDATYWSCGLSCPSPPSAPFVVGASGANARGFDIEGTAVYFGFGAPTSKIGRCGTLPPDESNCNTTLFDFNTDKTGEPGELIVRANSLYWTEGDPAVRITRAANAKNAPSATITTSVDPIISIDADATNVFWTNDKGVVSKVSVNGGTASVLARNQGDAAKLRLGPTDVFWLTNNQLVKRAK